jgi:hypothetical protein
LGFCVVCGVAVLKNVWMTSHAWFFPTLIPLATTIPAPPVCTLHAHTYHKLAVNGDHAATRKPCAHAGQGRAGASRAPFEVCSFVTGDSSCAWLVGTPRPCTLMHVCCALCLQVLAWFGLWEGGGGCRAEHRRGCWASIPVLETCSLTFFPYAASPCR